ncbi:MAG: hypothetical protein Q4B67_00420 [Eubacteriales bacterium]|nr:hypothetical protein [Eubacteriales bacterium]
MPVLLAGKMAKTSFHIDKLNISINGLEELCFLIYTYPLVALDAVLSKELAQWIEESQLGGELAAKLKEGFKTGDSPENMLLYILQSTNYLTNAELRGFVQEAVGIRRYSESGLLRETGRMYYRLGLYQLAYAKLEESVSNLEEEIKHAKDELELISKRNEKSDVLCDMVAVCMLRFDEVKAVKLLDLSEQTGRFKRAEEYRYLITGEAFLSEEEKEALDIKRKRLETTVREKRQCRKIKELPAKDPVKLLKDAGEILCEWKKEYRKTG